VAGRNQGTVCLASDFAEPVIAQAARQLFNIAFFSFRASGHVDALAPAIQLNAGITVQMCHEILDKLFITVTLHPAQPMIENCYKLHSNCKWARAISIDDSHRASSSTNPLASAGTLWVRLAAAPAHRGIYHPVCLDRLWVAPAARSQFRAHHHRFWRAVVN